MMADTEGNTRRICICSVLISLVRSQSLGIRDVIGNIANPTFSHLIERSASGLVGRLDQCASSDVVTRQEDTSGRGMAPRLTQGWHQFGGVIITHFGGHLVYGHHRNIKLSGQVR
jgi:hypothetical protein